MPDQRTLKRRRTCLDNGTMTPPSVPPTSAATHATSEETHPPEQSQQSSASRDPSLKHILIHTNPPHSFGYKVSSDGCDGTNTNSTRWMTTDGTSHQSFSHLGLASSQNKPIQGTPGRTSSQCLQYKEPVDEPINEDKDNGSSKSSSPASLCTAISTQERHQGRKHIYRADIEAGDFIEIGGRDQPHQLRLSSDGEQSNSMSLNP